MEIQKIMDICKGNPGAMSVIIKLIDAAKFDVIEEIKEMGMRGCQIWIGYKDFCHEDIEDFASRVSKKDGDMIDLCNRECPDLDAIVRQK